MVLLNLMADNHKRRLLTTADDDIITNISEHLIDLILERLPIKDAVKTSILSKRWRYRWTTMRTIVLHAKFSKKISKIGAYHRNGQPLEFQGFLNLEDMFLTRIDFGGNSGGNVINLPQLEKLTLHSCFNVYNFNIKAGKLHKLWVVRCPDAMLLRLLHSEHLDAVRFLAAEKFPKWLPQTVKCLKQLEFQSFSFCDLDQLEGGLCMLRNSPNLEVLRVTNMEMGLEAEVELTSGYLEQPDCLKQTLFMLHTVEMTYLEGSRPELMFMKLLLDHSPHLENMIIRPRATADAQKMLNIAKDVMLLPRASAKAKMVYLDPVP
ncbi:hypothetical protein E3N88_14040 [Mikania micrantha]|uniref:FBD domain-containing protein n=1 Tax=Mikania micrantha TaxID=192012 RepID=A0A5N6P094_9ASTR|nr:hypothetical protein E3N88_14040 [Mikania micrantha]